MIRRDARDNSDTTELSRTASLVTSCVHQYIIVLKQL